MDKGESTKVSKTSGSDDTDAKPCDDPGRPESTESVPSKEPESTARDELDSDMSRLDAASDPYTYDMTFKNRGYFIIINNKKFEPQTRKNERSGTDVDAENLHVTFTKLGFNVERNDNLSSAEMIDLMEKVSGYDHSQSDCFGVAILSHGDEGIVYGTDQIVKIETLVTPFKGDMCPSLVGKPKMFIIQACRGTELDHGVQHDDPSADQGQVYRIPTEADILYAYSTVAGYFAWRNKAKGSWFIQALCQQIEKYGTTKNMMSILTRVSRQVAFEFESNSSQGSRNKKKQIPSNVSMLTKELVFHQKG